MLVRLCFTFFSILATALAAGDLSLPPHASVSVQGNYSVGWYLTPRNSIVFAINQTGFGYFGISYLPSMTNSDMTIVEINNGVVTAGDYWSTSTRRPVVDARNDINLLAWDTDQKSYVRVKFERALDTGDNQDNALTEGEVRKFSLAWASTPTMSFHRKNLLTFSGKLQNSSSIDGIGGGGEVEKEKPVDKLVLAHGIVLTICWCLLADLALFVVVFRYKWWAVLVHAALMLAAIAASLALVFVLVRKKGGLKEYNELEHLEQVHFILGIIVLSWTGLQLITGILTRLLQVFTRVHPFVIICLNWLHRIPGYLLILLAKATCLVGWWMFNKVAFWIVLGWCILTTLLYLFRWTILDMLTSMSRSFHGLPQYPLEKSHVKRVLTPQLLQAYPYNAQELRGLNYVTFGDYVWDLSKNLWVHPGGNRLVDQVRGREIDRFIYGMYTEETTTMLSPYEHSKSSMMAAGPPLFRLPQQPVFQGMPPIGSYYASSIQCFSKDHFIVYLKPVEGQLVFIPQTNLSYLGRYYTVNAYGVTRLYTTVHCMNRNNRFFVGNILRTYGVAIPETTHFYSRESPTLGGYEAVQTERNIFQMNVLPGGGANQVALMMKKYDTGKLTSFLFSAFADAKLNVSAPMGRGLCLSRIRRGRVVIIAGGTGFYPFADLVDLLFKYTLLQKRMASPNQILALSPCLNNPDIFAGFEFVIYGAFHSLASLYGLQLLAMQFTARENPDLLKVFLKVTDKSANPASLSGITLIDDRFDAVMMQRYQIVNERTSMIYVCGPPAMNMSILSAMKTLGVDPSRYFIV